MLKKVDKKGNRLARHARVRRNLSGTSSKPRLAVFRSGKHMYAQIIDDGAGHTLASASTLDKSLGIEQTGNVEAAKKIGEAIARKAKDLGIEEVVFDRGGFVYHGRVRAVADGAREAGLKF